MIKYFSQIQKILIETDVEILFFSKTRIFAKDKNGSAAILIHFIERKPEISVQYLIGKLDKLKFFKGIEVDKHVVFLSTYIEKELIKYTDFIPFKFYLIFNSLRGVLRISNIRNDSTVNNMFDCLKKQVKPFRLKKSLVKRESEFFKGVVGYNSFLKLRKSKNMDENLQRSFELFIRPELRRLTLYEEDENIFSKSNFTRFSFYGPLTSFLRKDRDFWRKLTPGVSHLIRDINKEAVKHDLKVFLNPENRYYAGYISVAIDYYLGWFYGDDLERIFSRVRKSFSIFDDCYFVDFDNFHNPTLSGVTYLNSKKFSGKTVNFKNNIGVILTLFKRLLKRLKLECSSFINQSLVQKKMLLLILLYLAQLEEYYMSSSFAILPITDGLENLDIDRDPLSSYVDWFEKVIPRNWVEEGLQLIDALNDLLLKTNKKVMYKIDFGGYGPITKSEADLVIDDVLYDLKCTVRHPTVVRNIDIQQLLTYAAFNVINKVDLPIKKIGIINPRRKYVWIEDLNFVCREIGLRRFDLFLKNIKNSLKNYK